MRKKIDLSRLMRSGASMRSMALALVLPSLCAPACAGNMSDGKSGETHFLCQSDDDCSRHFHNDDYSCANGTFCTPRGDGGATRGSGGQGGGGGSAGDAGGVPGSAGGSAGSAGGGAGSAGGSDTDAGNAFAQCETPPDSTCSVADTCMQLGCGTSLQYDEHGCARTQCSTDDDCAADERCALSSCEAPATCSAEAGKCSCTILLGCGQVPRCNPISLAGSRGSWVSLDVTQTSGPCATPEQCTSTWHVGPDGHVTGSVMGKAIDKQIDVAQLFDLRGQVDGALLRTALRDGLPCMAMQVTDVDLTVSLKLSTQTLTQHANGCIATDNVFSNLYQLLSHLP